tara:strand:- start:947 stop:2080 length:1134 start_codon:yes stop_codon:yes gene_type:complete
VKVSIHDLRENPENPRSISGEKFEKLVNSIRQFPEMMEARPIVVDENNVILGGNMRFKAAKEAGLQEVDVYVASWDEAKNPEFIIKDNVGFGEWDWDMLANEWDAVLLDDWGLDVWQEEEEKEGLTDADEVPEVPADPITQLGDLWILGEHRLLCGDSTKAEDVERLMDGEKADMVYTDPPYGMDLDTDYTKMTSTSLKHNRVIGDDVQFHASLVLSSFEYCDEVFLWGADYYVETLGRNYPNLGSWIVWDKRSNEENIGLLDKAFGSDFELCWSKAKHKREMCRILRQTGHFEARSEDKRVHPTQKPVKLAEWFFERWGKGRTNIVDLFLGSGSTLIAAEKTGRKCYGMELDPKYCDVIVKRWEDFTGQKASKANA